MNNCESLKRKWGNQMKWNLIKSGTVLLTFENENELVTKLEKRNGIQIESVEFDYENNRVFIAEMEEFEIEFEIELVN